MVQNAAYIEDESESKWDTFQSHMRYSFRVLPSGRSLPHPSIKQVSLSSDKCIKVLLDGKEMGYIDFPPHRLDLGEISEGEHTVDLILYGNRMNTFGQLHKTNEQLAWTGPDSWRTKGRFWTDEYMLTRTGILSAPAILTEED